MSENKHTPEPWRSEGLTILDADGHIIFRMDVSFYLPEERKEAARRITACVNACAGIDTELLEIIEDNDKTLAGVIANVEKQRDELLAELEKMNRAYVILMESARDRICDLGGECDGIEVMERNDPYLRESRAAIASVKELK